MPAPTPLYRTIVADPTLARLDEIAADIGRLRKRLNTNTAWTGAHICDRIANNLQTLHAIHTPTAAQLAATTAPGDETALTEAIRIVDEQQRKFRQLLGEAA